MSLIAHYKLDGNVVDVIGNNSGTTTGSVGWVEGKLGLCADFTPSGGMIEGLRPVGSTYSISFWVLLKSGTAGTYRKFLQQGGNRSPGFWFHASSNILHLRANLSTDGNAGVDTITPLTIGQWQHVVMSCKQTNAGVYLNSYQDGVLEKQELYANAVVLSDGVDIKLLATDYQIDDFKVYDHALSQREVWDLSRGLMFHLDATSDKASDKSKQGMQVNNVGANYQEDSPVGNSSYLFNATGQYVSTGYNFPFKQVGEFSVAFWLKAGDHSARAGAAAGVVGKGHWFDNSWDVYIRNSNAVAFETSGNPTRTGIATLSAPVASLGVWEHYTFTYNNGVKRGFKNGIEFGSQTYSGPGDFNNSRHVLLGMRSGDASRTLIGSLADVRIYASELNADEVRSLYQQRASLDDQGNFYANLINDTNIKQELNLNYTQWEAGQTGAVGMFPLNGSTTENYRITDTDPWGKSTVVWEARPDATSGADGGWNADYQPAQSDKLYRFSTWVRRPVVGNGSFYLGCNGSPAVLSRSTGGSYSNPYFYSGSMSYTDWVLVVGHVWPEGSGTGATHPESGIYDVNGKLTDNVGDFTFAPGTTTIRHRSYLYYSTDINTRQQWVYPRMDICDGTEPSIAELLAGFDSRNEAALRKHSGQVPGQSIAKDVSHSFSEVGITNGLVAYYPLQRDAKDYSGKGSNGVVTGAVPVGGGFDGGGAYRFSGTGTYVDLPDAMEYGPEVSAMAWFKSNGAPGANYHVVFGGQQLEITIPVDGSVRTGVYTTSRHVSNHGTGVVDGQWHHVGFTFKGGVKLTFLDGIEVGSMSGITGTLTNSVSSRRIGVFGTSTQYFANGDICNAKIFNRALSPEEIAIEYKRTGPSKMVQHTGTTYIQGQLKEVS